jgi:hypothetical protein
MGHYCRFCGRVRANEKFSGRGHRDHVCKDCQRKPRAVRDRIECLEELHGFLHQSNISAKNIERLKLLSRNPQPEVASLASLVLAVARVLPGKRNRWLKLSRCYPDLFNHTIAVLGREFFEDLLAVYGDFESPLWEVLTNFRLTPPWTGRPCDCGSGLAFRACCMERENAWADKTQFDDPPGQEME